MGNKSIAVIGGGCAGVAAAWRLSEQHEVTLFEAAPRLGGHARTVTVSSSDGPVHVDMGVELIAAKVSPNVYAAIREAGAETFVLPLTFAASFGPDDHWRNDERNTSALWRRIEPECIDFQERMAETLNESLADLAPRTIGDLVAEQGYSSDFVNKALLPVFSAFSGTRASLLEFSLTYCATSFNENLLSFFQPPLYWKVRGGLASYLPRLLAGRNVTLRLETSVQQVTRTGSGVRVALEGDREARFDEVVLATHSDVSLSLLSDASADERELLGHFEYNEAECVVHTDPGVLSPYFERRPGFEYNYVGDELDSQLPGSITRNVAITNHHDPERVSVFVTLNPQGGIDPAQVIARQRWKHTKLRPRDMAVKRQFHRIQGARRTWFCGMDATLTGHEGAFTSGMVVAEAIGVPYPYAGKPWRRRHYDIVKQVMGLGSHEAK